MGEDRSKGWFPLQSIALNLGSNQFASHSSLCGTVCVCSHVRIQQEDVIYEYGKVLSWDRKCAGTLSLDFQPLWLWEINVAYKPLGL